MATLSQREPASLALEGTFAPPRMTTAEAAAAQTHDILAPDVDRIAAAANGLEERP